MLDAEYPVTHDLNVLFGILRRKGFKIKNERSFIKLNLYAVLFRYVASQSGIKPLKRETINEQISDLLDQVAKHVE